MVGDNKIFFFYMILFCIFKSLIKIVELKNIEFLCGKVVFGKSVFYNWRWRGKKYCNLWILYNKFFRENIVKIFFFELIIDFIDFIWFIFFGFFCWYYCYLWLEVGVRMFCKVFFCLCIIVFFVIMDKIRNFLYCFVKILYVLNVGDFYWII